jgi:predicted ribosome quality control (RQC) complex YloA/Tae2 family protein
MNYQILLPVVEELSRIITGARVDRVYEGRRRELYLLLSRDRRRSVLLLSPERSMPRLHLVSKKPAATSSPPGFSLYLRSRATGARITRVSLLNEDRVVEIRFSRQGEEYHLVFELIGSAANIVLTDSSLTILAVYYPLQLADRVKRLLAPGMQYALPEKKSNRARSPGPETAVRSDQLFPYERGGSAGANRAAEIYFERISEERGMAALRGGLQSIVNKTLARTGRKIKALSADRESAQRAEEYRLTGDLILTNLSRLRQGMEQATLTGYDGGTLLVHLDPKRSPAGNADLYFKKYKKAKAGNDIIQARMRQAVEEEARSRSFLSKIERADNIDTLSSIRSELVADGYIHEGVRETGKKRSVSPPAPFRKIVYRGWDILVGKSAAGNDYLSMKIARPGDLWLHAEGMPGSHVLVKNPEARDIPQDVFARAASLAAFYSKGKNAGKVAVTYTLARHVRKPRGAKPGLVTLAERKTVMAVPVGD